MFKMIAVVSIFSIQSFSALALDSTSINPSKVLKKMSHLKNYGALLVELKKNMSPQDSLDLDKISKTVQITNGKPLKIKVIGKNRIKFGQEMNQFIFSHSGKHLKYKKLIFQLDKKKSLFWNYSNVMSALKARASAGTISVIPQAHAASQSDEQSGYDILALMYYMNIYKKAD